MQLTKEQDDIRKAAKEFSAGELAEDALHWDEAGETPLEVIKKAQGLGFVGMTLRETVGGPGLGLLEECLVIEEFSAESPGAARACLEPGFGCELMPEPLPRLVSGLTEGEVRLGLGIPESPIHREEEKGQISVDIAFVPATADVFLIPGYQENREGLFFVPRNVANVTLTPMVSKLGFRAWPGAKMTVRDGDFKGMGFVPVPECLKRAQSAGAIRGAAAAMGISRGAVRIALLHAKNRRLFGQTLADLEATQEKFLRAWSWVEGAKGLAFRATGLWDRKADASLWAVAAWSWSIKAALEITEEAVQLHGGYGYFEEMKVAMYYRDAKMLELMTAPMIPGIAQVWPMLSASRAWEF